jgi:hypothetical protein
MKFYALCVVEGIVSVVGVALGLLAVAVAIGGIFAVVDYLGVEYLLLAAGALVAFAWGSFVFSMAAVMSWNCLEQCAREKREHYAQTGKFRFFKREF